MFLTALSTRVSPLSSKIHNGDDTLKERRGTRIIQRLAILQLCILRGCVRPVKKFREKIGCELPRFLVLFIFNFP